jgi:hypothetical protein
MSACWRPVVGDLTGTVPNGIHARITADKPLIPVIVGSGAVIPALVRPLARRGIEEIDSVIDGLCGRTAKPPLGPAPERGRTERVGIVLKRSATGGSPDYAPLKSDRQRVSSAKVIAVEGL